jgi:hypothetical protein
MNRLIIAATLALLSAGPTPAACYEEIGCTDGDKFRKSDLSEFSCQLLWDVRNTIYKENGYCFQTKKARNYFGNDGCYVDDMEEVKMSSIERHNVGQIVAVEKALGC